MNTCKTLFCLVISILLVVLTNCNTVCKKESIQKDLNEWYYPNGTITSRNTNPDNPVYDITGFAQEWLRIINFENHEINVKLIFYTEEEPPTDTTITIPVNEPYGIYQNENEIFGKINVNQIYGLGLKSEGKILAQFVRYETESNPVGGIPGNHIQSNIGYPGPLGNNEKKWAYADCYTQITDTTVLERERLNILNPSLIDGEVKITFINTSNGDKTYYNCKIGAERLISLSLLSLPPEIFNERIVYSVIVESTVPVVAMQLRRFYFKKNQSPRGMIGMMAYPIGNYDIFK